MNQGSAQPPAYDDEIDLFELAQSLWQEKLLIIAITVITTAVAIGYALMATPVYEARATLVIPHSADVHTYNEGREPLKLKQYSPKEIFEHFTAQLRSRQLRNEFFEQTYLPYLPEEKQDAARDALLASMNKLLAVKQVDPKNMPGVYQVSVQLDDPETAAQWVQAYVDLAVMNTKTELKRDIQAEIQLKINGVKKNLEALRETAMRERMAEITRLQEALQIADAVGQESPVMPAGKAVQEAADYIDRNLTYLRGSKALRAQIKTLQERKSDDPFVDGIYEQEVLLAQLENIVINDASAQVVRIDEAAEVPETRIKPKRSLVAAMGLVAGGMLGVFIALIRSAVRKRKKETV